MPPSAAWTQVQKILCIRLDSMGDVLMTMPAVRALRDSLPGSRVTLLTSPEGAEPAPFLPEVDDVIVYEAPWLKASPQRANSAEDLAMLQQVSAAHFDAAVIFTVYSQSPLPAALFCTLANIPLRLAHCRENPYHLLSDWIKESEPEQHIRHEVKRQLDLVAQVGCHTGEDRLRFCIPKSACRRALRALHAAGVDLGHPWMVIHPGVSAPSRQYAPDKYAQAAHQLVQDDGMQVVFTGTEREAELIAGIQAAMNAPSTSLAGRLAIDELAAVLHLAPLLLTNNTGPVHLAAAVGTPVIDLYALTNPQHTPWGVPHRVLFHDVPCKFCYKSICPEGHHHCLEKVTPGQLVAAVRDLLNETR